MRAITTVIAAVMVLISAGAANGPGPASVVATIDSRTDQDSPIAKNVIFLIGDGMGLTQISAGMYMNKNKIALEKFPIVGIHKSHAYNDLITDSAAGATAFSCGVKTVNGAIGINHEGVIQETLLEEAERKGLATGMIATSTIVHATPAAFAAHVANRRQYEDIALAYMDIEVDLLIGGGRAFFNRRKDEKDLYADLRRRNYYVTDFVETDFKDLKIPDRANVAYFTADREPLSASQGRDYLVPATELALDYMVDKSPKGFFLMIEGSQIDWGGHANDANYVIDEFTEFDKVIEICYNFARKNKETLVIVTADHETGGLAINPDSQMGELKTAFTTGGHTACMIPVFAFGPGAERFSGIYDNTDIHTKVRQAYGWKR